MSQSGIRLGIIGCGLIAQAHGRAALNSNRDVYFAACSSRTSESTEAFAAEFGCEHIEVDHKALAARNDVDGIVITTPPDSHSEIITDAIEVGCRHILCEKPLTLNANEAMRVARCAQQHGAIVLEGFMYRYHPQIRALIEIIRSAELGTVDQIHCSINMLDASEIDGSTPDPSWRRETDFGGVLHDFLCYPIDLANLIVGEQPKRALGQSYRSAHSQSVYRFFGMLEFESGAIASIAASRLSDFSQPLFIGCQNGTIRMDTAFNPVGDTEIRIHESTGLIAQRQRSMKIPSPPSASDMLLDLPVFQFQLEHFADVIEGRAQPEIVMNESVRNAKARDALIKSGASGAWCSVV